MWIIIKDCIRDNVVILQSPNIVFPFTTPGSQERVQIDPWGAKIVLHTPVIATSGVITKVEIQLHINKKTNNIKSDYEYYHYFN